MPAADSGSARHSNYTCTGPVQAARMTRVRQWLAFILMTTLVACGSRSGENVSYAIWNRSSTQDLRDAALFVTDGRGEKQWLAASSRQDPLPPGEDGWQSGGAAQLPDAGHRVPENLQAAWRSNGMPQGPFRMDLRARIPADVLEKIRGSTRYQLEIGVGAGDNRPTARWRLIEKAPDRPGMQEIQRGGEW